MKQAPENGAGSLLTEERARSLQANAGNLQKLAESADGKKVRKLLGDEKRAAKALETKEYRCVATVKWMLDDLTGLRR